MALVGNFACIPAGVHLPGEFLLLTAVRHYCTGILTAAPHAQPMLHYRGVARGVLWKAADVALCIFGFIAMAYTTSLTVMSWANSDGGPNLPGYCDSKRL